TNYWRDISILSKAEWDAIEDKGATCGQNGIPSDFWAQPTYPNTTIRVWPIPSTGVIINLGTWEELQQFVTIFDTVNFPPGYQECIVTNLAMELAPYYHVEVSPAMQQLAADAMLKIQAIN